MGTVLGDEYQRRLAESSDMARHLPKLAELASEVGHATEFGVRKGNSTIALLSGLGRHGSGTLVSFDREDHDVPQDLILPSGVAWHFVKTDIATLNELEPTGLLLIDSWHTREHVAKELQFAPAVWRYLVFHDVTSFAGKDQGDGGGMGICPAIWDFLVTPEGMCWRPHYHDAECNGLLVLKRFE